MHRLFSIWFFSLSVLAPLPLLAQSSTPQDFLPKTRVSYFQKTDFLGRDLEKHLNITSQNCAALCQSDENCAGFTYNTRASACFTKTNIKSSKSHKDALGALVFRLSPRANTLANTRVKDLAFLDPYFLSQLGLAHSKVENYTPNRDEKPQTWQRLRNNVLQEDSAKNWLFIAEYLNAQSNYGAGRLAPVAAASSYIRAKDTRAQSQALVQLAKALEERHQGYQALQALRFTVQLNATKEAKALLKDAEKNMALR